MRMPAYLGLVAVSSVALTCTSSPPGDLPVGGSPNAGGSSSATTGGAGGSTGAGGGGGSTPIAGGQALVRFCNALVRQDEKPVTVELQLAGQRLKADSRACAPAAGAACVAVPAGDHTLKAMVGADQREGFARLQPGLAYVIRADAVAIDQNSSFVWFSALELESADDCNTLDYQKALRRTEPPIALEPFKADGWSFAKPVGFKRTGGGPATHVFEPEDPAADLLSRFQISYLGRLPDSQAPSASALLKQAMEQRKLTLVGKIETGAEYAAATGDTGVDGPGRFVRLLYLRHWELGDEFLAPLASLTGKRPAQVDLFTAEFAFSLPSVEQFVHLPFVMKSIAWGVAIPVDEVPAAELPGTWEATQGGLGETFVDGRGNYTGSLTDGSMFRITLGADGKYDLLTVYSARCSGRTIGCLEGVAAAQIRGRYQMAGGEMTLYPWQCEQRWYNGNVILESTSPCGLATSPIALRVARGRSGGLLLTGLGGDVLRADSQRMFSATRKQGAAGPWNVTEMDRAAQPAPMSAGDVAICGAVTEKEPNDTAAETNAYTMGQDATGCIPTTRDADQWELSAPASGFFVGTLTPSGDAKPEANVESVVGQRQVVQYAYSVTPGTPVYFFWSSVAGEKYRIRVKPSGGGGDWFKYTLNVAFTPVNDTQEPNDTSDAAKPVTLGAPVNGYFFAGHKDGLVVSEQHSDWFSVTLQPGLVTIKVDDVAPDVVATLRVQDAQGRGVYHESLQNYTAGANLAGTPMIMTAGSYAIGLSYHSRREYAGKIESRTAVPESFTRPYRLTVTQP